MHEILPGQFEAMASIGVVFLPKAEPCEFCQVKKKNKKIFVT
jgi:hypothetical protein